MKSTPVPTLDALLDGTEGVLFDLDGVLLDTEDLYTEATQAIVGRFGKSYGWPLKRRTMGRDARYGARLLLDELAIPMTVEQFLSERDPILVSLLSASPAKPGADAFVRRLFDRKVPMAVGTSSSRRLYDLKVAPHSFFELFGAVVCGDDPRVGSKKPAPDIFLVAADSIEVAPERCVVFEDSIAGVEAALRAGMRVVALPDPALDPVDFQGAHHVVEGGWEELLC